MTNELYKEDYVHGKRTKHPTYYENVVKPLVSKQKWDDCQYQKLRNTVLTLINQLVEISILEKIFYLS